MIISDGQQRKIFKNIGKDGFVVDRFLRTLSRLKLEGGKIWMDLFDEFYEPGHPSWWKRNAR